MDALAELLAGASRSKKPSIDAFLAGVRALGDATPSNKDLEVVRQFEVLLTSLSATDHLKSTDETLAHVPTEFAAAKEALSQAESFVFMAASGQLDKTTRMLDASWQLLHAIDRDGHTALHSAAAQGHVDICTMLLKRGANAKSQDYEGMTPLHWAVENCHLAVVEVLMESGGDAGIKSNAGRTPVDMVVDHKPKLQGSLLAALQATGAAGAASAAGLTSPAARTGGAGAVASPKKR